MRELISELPSLQRGDIEMSHRKKQTLISHSVMFAGKMRLINKNNNQLRQQPRINFGLTEKALS